MTTKQEATKQLIKLQDKYLLISDEEIPYNLNGGTNGNFLCLSEIHQNNILGLREGDKGYVTPFVKNVGNCKSCKKIIAGIGIPGLPSIDFSSLSEEDCKTIRWIDVEKLAKEAYIKHSDVGDGLSLNEQIQRTGGFNVGFKEGFKEGFQTTQSNEMFSLEDIKKAIEMARQCDYGYDVRKDETYCDWKSSDEEIIQSLQQTSWDVKVEMESVYPVAYKIVKIL